MLAAGLERAEQRAQRLEAACGSADADDEVRRCSWTPLRGALFVFSGCVLLILIARWRDLSEATLLFLVVRGGILL